MKKVFKWIGIVLGSLMGSILVVGVVLYFIGNARLNKVYTVEPSNLSRPPTQRASIMGDIAQRRYARVVTVQI